MEKILEYSFGYDMTINEYYLVLKENGKTAVCQQIGRIVKDDSGRGSGTSQPNPNKKIGEPFRATVRKDGYYASKYFGGGYQTEHARPWDGKPSYYNTWD